MTKMSSTLRRSENCRRGRKSWVSSQSAAGDLYCAIISTLCTSSRKTPSSLNALQYKKQISLYCFTTNQYKTWLQNVKLFALRCKYLSGRSCHLVLFAFLLCCCWTSINAPPTCFICKFVFVCLPNMRATTRRTWQCKCAPCTAAEELVATSSLFLDRLNLNLKCNHHPSTTL